MKLKCDSSAISEIEYNPATKELLIQFTSSDKKYSYPDVEQSIYDGFVQCAAKGESIGRHYYKVKNAMLAAL